MMTKLPRKSRWRNTFGAKARLAGVCLLSLRLTAGFATAKSLNGQNPGSAMRLPQDSHIHAALFSQETWPQFYLASFLPDSFCDLLCGLLVVNAVLSVLFIGLWLIVARIFRDDALKHYRNFITSLIFIAVLLTLSFFALDKLLAYSSRQPGKARQELLEITNESARFLDEVKSATPSPNAVLAAYVENVANRIRDIDIDIESDQARQQLLAITNEASRFIRQVRTDTPSPNAVLVAYLESVANRIRGVDLETSQVSAGLSHRELARVLLANAFLWVIGCFVYTSIKYLREKKQLALYDPAQNWRCESSDLEKIRAKVASLDEKICFALLALSRKSRKHK